MKIFPFPVFSSIQPIEDFVEEIYDGRHAHNFHQTYSGSQEALPSPLVNTNSPENSFLHLVFCPLIFCALRVVWRYPLKSFVSL